MAKCVIILEDDETTGKVGIIATCPKIENETPTMAQSLFFDILEVIQERTETFSGGIQSRH